MDLTDDAVGVIATVIPVYLLVLAAGRTRLMRPFVVGGWSSRAVDAVAIIMTLLLTLGEMLALLSYVNPAVATGVGGLIVVIAVLQGALVTGLAIALEIAWPERELQ